MTATGKARPSAALAPALFRAPIAATSRVGTSRAVRTNIRQSGPTSSPCFNSRRVESVAQVLTAAHPDGQLSSWKWDYPVGAGDYYSLYPKSWYDYRWDKFPAHVTLEQFSPVLPNNYRQSSFPVAVYGWHAENPTDKPVTVSVLLSWTNMLGWFRDFGPDMRGALNQGNHNRFIDENAASGHIKGIVFDRTRPKGGVQAEF